MSEYRFPPISLLMSSEESSRYQSLEQSKKVGEKVNKMFKDLGYASRVVDYKSNPYSTVLKVKPNGVKISTIRNMRQDLEYATASYVEFQEKQAEFFIAVKRNYRPVVSLREVMEKTEYRESESLLPVAAGINLFGDDFVIDLMKDHNLLVAGVTGAGKSIFLADIILSVLFRSSPDDVQMILMDNKGVDLPAFNGIPHLCGKKVAVSIREEIDAFLWLLEETNKRVAELSSKAKSIDEYNEKYGHKFKHILVVVDEYSQLMQLEDETREALLKIIEDITKQSRLTGIHLVLATQNPSKEVITDKIKINIEARASFTIVDETESRTILGMTGTERLMGGGDMIFSSPLLEDEIHGRSSYVSDVEIDRVVAFLKIRM